MYHDCWRSGGMVAGRKEDFVSSRNLPLAFALRLGGPVSAFIVGWRPERPSSRPHADDLLPRRKSSQYMPLSTLDARIRIRDWFLDPLLRSFVPLMIASPPLDDKEKRPTHVAPPRSKDIISDPYFRR